MRSLHSFANYVCGLSAHTVEAGTHRFHFRSFGIAGKHITADPAKFFIGYPSLLAGRRSNPNFRFSTGVNYGKAPFGFQVKNIAVGNQISAKRINNFNIVGFQNQLGLNPKKVDKQNENCTESKVADDLNIAVDNPYAIDSEERNQEIGSCRPRKVASGPKGFIHRPSIAGEGK